MTTAETASDRVRPLNHVPTLDGLRGIAVAMVLGTHVPSELVPEAPRLLTHVLDASGYLGVDIFFVLSGFLITRILLNEPGPRVLPFMLRRAARIFPLYYLTLALCAAYAPESALAWSAVYASNYWLVWHTPGLPLGHLWSLSVEEHFYLAWPWLVKRIRSQTSFRILWLGILPASLIASVALVALDVPHADHLVYSGTQSRIWSLGLGALCAYREPVARAVARIVYAHPVLSSAACVAVLATGIFLARLGLRQVGYLLAYSIVSLGAVLLALGVPEGTRLHRLMSSGPLSALGRVSYGVYVVHPFIFRAIGDTIDWLPRDEWSGFVMTYALGTTMSYGVAFISYHAYEIRMIHFGRAWSARLLE